MTARDCGGDAWRARLAACLDGELSPGEAREVRAHLAGCPRCAREAAVLELLAGAFAGLPEWNAPPEVAAGVMARLALHPRRWWQRTVAWQPWLRVAYLGSLAASLVLGFELSGLRLAVSAPAGAVARGALSQAALLARALRELAGPLGKLESLGKTAGTVGESLVKAAEAQSPEIYGAGVLAMFVLVLGMGACAFALRSQRRVSHARLAG